MIRAVLVAVALLWSGEVGAQERSSTVWGQGETCGSSMFVSRELAKYGERPIGARELGAGKRRVMFASAFGTWTIVDVEEGQACLREAGKDWEPPTTLKWPQA